MYYGLHMTEKLTEELQSILKNSDLGTSLNRIADALDRMSPPARTAEELAQVLENADAFIWQAENSWLEPVPRVNRIELALLKGIDHQADLLVENTLRFSKGLPANNALLWGARGTGKSSIVKAVHSEINRRTPGTIAMIEIHREDLTSLPTLLHILRDSKRACLVFCDDLSFDGDDASYKSLKAVLEGGLEGRPANVLFYATSNRRHLMPRDMIENERSTAINPAEAVEEKVSLSDRFGLWLGFHACDQDTYFAIIDGYAQKLELDITTEQLHREAKEWTMTRGSRSGRVAWQFIQDLAGRMGKEIEFDKS